MAESKINIDSIKAVTGFSLTTNSYLNNTSNCRCSRCGRVVQFDFSGQTTAIPNGTYGSFIKGLPKPYRVVFFKATTSVSQATTLPLQLDTDGNITTASNNGYSAGWFTGSVTYLTSE